MTKRHAARRPDRGLSDLSVTEFLALARMGFLPHGLVVGCAVWDAGGEFTIPGRSGLFVDPNAIAHGLRVSRQLALSRMVEQAAGVHAEGVVGVRLTVEHHRWRGGHQIAKVLAVGTAVAFDPGHAPREFADAPPLTVHGDAPFTSDLSGQDFVALLHAGYRPVALATGNSLYAIDPQVAQAYSGSRRNEEIAVYTQAFFDARETAMDVLAQDVFALFPRGHRDAPVGVVGMQVKEERHYGYVEFIALGTAVAPVDPNDPRHADEHPSPQVVVPLDR